MTDLRELLHGAVDPPDDVDVDAIGRRAGRRRGQHRVLVVAAVIVVIGMAAALVVRSRTGADEQRIVNQPAPQGSLQRFPVAGHDLAISNDSIWIATDESTESSPGVVARLDRATGDERARVPMTFGADNVATAFDQVWVSAGNHLEQIDPVTSAARGQDLAAGHAAYALASTSDALWVTDPDAPVLLRFDLNRGLTDTIPLPAVAWRVSASGGDVWVSTEAGLLHIDAASKSIDVINGSDLSFLAAMANGVWTVDQGEIVRYDASGRRFTTGQRGSQVTRLAAQGDDVWVADEAGLRALDQQGHVVPGSNIDDRPMGEWNLAVGSDGAVWRTSSVDTIRWTPTPSNVARRGLRTESADLAGTSVLATEESVFSAHTGPGGGEILRFDPVTLAVSDVIETPNPVRKMAVGFGSLWAVGGGDGAFPEGGIARVDLATNTVVATIGRPALTPTDVAVGPDAVWVADGQSGGVLRIDPATNAITEEVAGSPYLPSTSATDGDGVWVIGSSDVHLSRPNGGRVETVANSALENVSAEEISVADGTLWIAQFSGPLVRWQPAIDYDDCASATQNPDSLGADALPHDGDTDLRAVQQVVAASGSDFGDQFHAADAVIAPRLGNRWARDANGNESIVYSDAPGDYRIVVHLRSADDCPDLPQTYNGVPLSFTIDR